MSRPKGWEWRVGERAALTDDIRCYQSNGKVEVVISKGANVEVVSVKEHHVEVRDLDFGATGTAFVGTGTAFVGTLAPLEQLSFGCLGDEAIREVGGGDDEAS